MKLAAVIRRPGALRALLLRTARFLALVLGAAAILQQLRPHPLRVVQAEPPRPVHPAQQSAVQNAPTDNAPLTGFTVCLDPGHGYDDSGAEPDGCSLPEKSINLAVALQLRTLLQQAGCTVLLTRDSDTPPDELPVTTDGQHLLTQSARVAFANEAAPDLFLSLHCDSFSEDPGVQGLRLYYCEATEYDSAGLCAQISSALSGLLGQEPVTEADGYGNAYQVNRDVAAPSVLIEMGFLTNEEDANKLSDSEWQYALAEAIAAGVAAYCGAS